MRRRQKGSTSVAKTGGFVFPHELPDGRKVYKVGQDSIIVKRNKKFWRRLGIQTFLEKMEVVV